MMGASAAHAYVPTIWINGTPNNIYTPLCRASICHEKGKRSPLNVNAQMDFFALAQWSNFAYGQCQACGVSLQGDMHMNRLLNGIYCQIYASALMNHARSYDYLAQRVFYNTLASLTDTHFLLGLNAVHKNRFRCSGYVFGIIPATRHSLFNSSKIISWVGLDDHFAWGVGIDLFVRVWGKKLHHVDWLADTDVTFLTSRKGLAWTKSNGIYQPCHIEICSSQLYKIRSALAYQCNYFISDIGIQLFCAPDLKYTSIDNLSKKTLEQSTLWASLFCDVGTTIQLCDVPSYAALGVQGTGRDHGYDSFNANFKFGINF
jgi:hypothetical protein